MAFYGLKFYMAKLLPDWLLWLYRLKYQSRIRARRRQSSQSHNKLYLLTEIDHFWLRMRTSRGCSVLDLGRLLNLWSNLVFCQEWCRRRSISGRQERERGSVLERGRFLDTAVNLIAPHDLIISSLQKGYRKRFPAGRGHGSGGCLPAQRLWTGWWQVSRAFARSSAGVLPSIIDCSEAILDMCNKMRNGVRTFALLKRAFVRYQALLCCAKRWEVHTCLLCLRAFVRYQAL